MGFWPFWPQRDGPSQDSLIIRDGRELGGQGLGKEGSVSLSRSCAFSCGCTSLTVP